MRLAILGATGAVGREVLSCLSAMSISCEDIVLLASEKSAGTTIMTPLGMRPVQAVSKESFRDIDFAIFSAGNDAAKTWAPIANEMGCIVIDNSSAFRYDDAVPLVIPEINAECALGGVSLIANPNCTTAIAAIAVYPLYRAFGIRRMIVSTYQSASGAGAEGMQELKEETRNALDALPAKHRVFAHPIAFNIIPHIDTFQENGYTREEMKVAWEIRKIFGDDALQISCTAVRIPVMRVHCESIVIETERPVTPSEARRILSAAAGVELLDDPLKGVYPMPLTATGKFPVQVGRIRQSLAFGEYGLEFFVAGDQLLKGAALNALQILSFLLHHS